MSKTSLHKSNKSTKQIKQSKVEDWIGFGGVTLVCAAKKRHTSEGTGSVMAESKKVIDISSVYKEKIWGKEEGGEQVNDGYVFRGKRNFKKAREGLESYLQRGTKTEID